MEFPSQEVLKMGYSLISGLFIIENIKISALCFPCVVSLTRIHALNCHNLPSDSAWDEMLPKNCSLLNPVSQLTLPSIGLLQSIALGTPDSQILPHYPLSLPSEAPFLGSPPISNIALSAS